MGRQANTSGKLSYYMKKKLERQALEQAEPEVVETEEQIGQKLTERFTALNLIADQTVSGKNKALIVSGPAGVGNRTTSSRLLGSSRSVVARSALSRVSSVRLAFIACCTIIRPTTM